VRFSQVCSVQVDTVGQWFPKWVGPLVATVQRHSLDPSTWRGGGKLTQQKKENLSSLLNTEFNK
jgi:hypothetical protein